jgi:hypothetical protein
MVAARAAKAPTTESDQSLRGRESGKTSPEAKTTANEIQVDVAQLGAFTRAVLKRASPDVFISFRTFPDDDKKTTPLENMPARAVKVADGLDAIVAVAIKEAQRAANHERRAVFCPPIAGFSNLISAKEKDLVEGYTLTVDLDSGKPREALAKLVEILGIEPTLLIESGGITDEGEPKLHGHWRLMKPARDGQLALLKDVRRWATKLIGSDNSSITIVHPIRWAGSLHRKGEPRICQILSHTENEIDLADAWGRLKPAEEAVDESEDDITGDSAPEDGIAYAEWWGAKRAKEIRESPEGAKNQNNLIAKGAVYMATMLPHKWITEKRITGILLEAALAGNHPRDRALAAIESGIETGKEKPPHKPLKKKRGPSVEDKLMALAAPFDLFHAPGGVGYADVTIDGHRETWPVESRGLRQHLQLLYMESTGKNPNTDALKSVMSGVIAKAMRKSPEREVHIRVAEHGGKIFLDLCNKTWQVVEVDADGWRIVESKDVPVRFLRRKGMLPLPMPQSGGSINELREFVNVHSEDDFVMLAAFNLSTLKPNAPQPTLAVSGPPGSAKTYSCRKVRELTDPNEDAVRTFPNTEEDFFLAALGNLVPVYDNVSFLKPEQADWVCRLNTGGSYVRRTKYEDSEETSFKARRPVVLNGIPDVATNRSDLAERIIQSGLRTIPNDRRRDENDLNAAFAKAHPRILGALLDAAAHGLRVLATTKIDNLSRMADFEQWVTACEGALWPAGTFRAAYAANRERVNDMVGEGDAVVELMEEFMQKHGYKVPVLGDGWQQQWSGNCKKMLTALYKLATNENKNPPPKGFPESERGLSSNLRRNHNVLARRGIEVSEPDDTDKTRTWTIALPPTNEPAPF